MSFIRTALMSALFIYATDLAANAALTPRIQANVNVESIMPATDEERRAIYLSAGRVLKHVDQARAALAIQDSQTAIAHIKKATLLADIIRRSLPKYEVTAEIRSGDLIYQDRDQVQDSVVPIYDELERAAILSPVKNAKLDARAESAPVGTAIVDVDLVQTRAELDIELARGRLVGALAAVKKNKLEAANDLLSGIQTSVRLTRVEIDLPLERARSNLMLARDRFGEGRHEDAQFALRVAMDALSEYSSTANPGRANEIKNLHEEMSRLEATLPSDARQAKEKLDAWWDVLSDWSR